MLIFRPNEIDLGKTLEIVKNENDFANGFGISKLQDGDHLTFMLLGNHCRMFWFESKLRHRQNMTSYAYYHVTWSGRLIILSFSLTIFLVFYFHGRNADQLRVQVSAPSGKPIVKNSGPVDNYQWHFQTLFKEAKYTVGNVKVDTPFRNNDEVSFSQILWNSSVDIAKAALSSHFLSSVQRRSMNHDKYGKWKLSEACYCHHAAKAFKHAALKAHFINAPMDLQHFLSDNQKSFERLSENQFRTEWNLYKLKCARLTTVHEALVNFHKVVLENIHPVYTIVGMIPRSVLGEWLQSQTLPHVESTNVFEDWVRQNAYSRMGLTVDHYLDLFVRIYPYFIDPDVAQMVYREAMYFEVERLNSW